MVARYDGFTRDLDHVLQVLDVVRGGQAEAAGLKPKDDYILGSEKQTFGGMLIAGWYAH